MIVWADELWLCEHGRVRRVWAPRGEAVRQRQDLGRACKPLILDADPLTGWVGWHWLPEPAAGGFSEERLLPVLLAWSGAGIAGGVWDNAPAHHGKRIRAASDALGLKVVWQPPNSPELNPAERLIQALRAATEGRTYGNLESKLAAAEAVLNQWAATPEQVKRLLDWSWIHQALVTLPP